MSLWTPYLEEPMDLTKQRPSKKAKLSHDWHIHEESSNPEDYLREGLLSPPLAERPGYSPLRDTSSPGSVGSDHVTEDPEYQAFERDALRAMAQSGRIVQNNPRMRRDIQSAQTDDQYRQQRQRNNMAAKMSRDRRKMREVKLGIQVAFLSRKLLELQSRLAEYDRYGSPLRAVPAYDYRPAH